MRKAFTLVELLIVVLVFVTLMSIVFRLSSIGSDSEARSRTIMTLQKIENCLSGYYAAFGGYPPVSLHGSRNYNLEVNANGVQTDREVGGGLKQPGTDASMSWRRVNAACRSQPVAMNFPFASNAGLQKYIEALADALKELHDKEGDEFKSYRDNPALEKGFDADALNKVGNRAKNRGGRKGDSDWRDIQLYRFGLMSYLLPRYLIMMRYRSDQGPYDDVAQWEKNNTMPCRFRDGRPYSTWEALANDVQSDNNKWLVKLIPNQAVTARWMPNLEGLLSSETDIECFGINLRDGRGGNLNIHNPNPPIFSGTKDSDGPSNQYVLDEITCRDGWGRELYYYSRPPHQSYTLWSAGKNGLTFPPWVPLESLGNADRIIASDWISDDINQMSN